MIHPQPPQVHRGGGGYHDQTMTGCVCVRRCSIYRLFKALMAPRGHSSGLFGLFPRCKASIPAVFHCVLKAFHVFKIFVANPSRPPRIQSILYKNKEKIAKLLMELAPYRAEDKQFTEAIWWL